MKGPAAAPNGRTNELQTRGFHIAVYLQDGARMSELGTIRDTVLALSSFRPDMVYHQFSARGGPVQLSSGPLVETEPSRFEARDGLLIIPGVEGHTFDPGPAAVRFSQASRQGWHILVLSEAIDGLMQRGCLENLTISLPWTNPASIDLLCTASVSPTIYTTERRVTTSVGQAATVHALLHVLAKFIGRTCVEEVADRLHVGYIRSPHARQRLRVRDRYKVEDPKLEQMLELFEARLEEPISMTEVSQRVGVSVRQLERLCKRHLGAAPKAIYNRIRAVQARWLVEETATPLTEVAMSCGYSSLSLMSRHFFRMFQEKPSDLRRYALLQRKTQKPGS